MVEHHVRDVGAAGSNPVTSTTESSPEAGELFIMEQDLNLRTRFREESLQGETEREKSPAETSIMSGKSKSPRPRKAPLKQGELFIMEQDLNLRTRFREESLQGETEREKSPAET